ncbi:putative metabolite transport protein YwtG [Halichondria panicea]|uniref:putative metabolite transport protein YwtG n=1 Tax=Halichondria panicea TaxID=6063 RepID=UPI00312BC458
MAGRDWAYVSFVAFFAALGAYLAGYGIGSVNGLQNFSGFLEFFDLGNSSTNASCTETSHLTEGSRLILGTIISIINLGGAIGILIAGKPADYFGRKITLVMSGVLVVLGGSIQSAAIQGASWMLILGRLIAGLGYGLFYLAGPVYIAEIAPKHIRGALTSLIGPAIALGVLTGYVTNIILFDKPIGWRVSRLLASIFGCVYILGMTLMPRTPRWLMLNGRESEAREVLRQTSSKLGQEGIEAELEDIRQSLESAKNLSIIQKIKAILKWKILKRVFLGIPLHFFAAGCGTAVFFYSEPLFCSLGIAPFVTAIVIGVMSLCGTIFTTLFIEKLGRKPMLVGGAVIMFLLTGAAATLVFAFNLEEENNDVVGYIVVFLVCLFMLVYSSTWYVIPWVVTSEIFPLEGRGVVVAIATTMNYGATYLFTQSFPSILASVKASGSLYMISIINIVAAVFYLFLLPETKGVSLEQMEKIFAKPWLERIGLASFFRFCRRPENLSTDVSRTDNGVVLTGGKLKPREDEKSSPQRRSDMEKDEDWEEYWKHETTV